jgi:Rieske Fe-S protein
MSLISRRGVMAFFTLIFSSVADSALGAIGPSVVCKKVGQTTIFNGKKYTCIKSGKKLIWDKGVIIPNPTPSQSSASPSPSSTPTTTPTVKPTPTISSVVLTLGESSEVKLGETVIFKGNDAYGRLKEYAVTRTESGLVALDTVCTHAGCSVVVQKKQLVCPCHLSYFDSISGSPESGPANLPLRKYPVKEESGKILLTD